MSKLVGKNDDNLIMMNIFNKELQHQLQLSLNLILLTKKKSTRSNEYKNNLFPLFESNKSTISRKSEKTTVRHFSKFNFTLLLFLSAAFISRKSFFKGLF